MTDSDPKLSHPRHVPDRLEKEETQLWRLVLMFLVLMATALGAVWWEPLQALPYRLGTVLPVAVLCITIAFVSFSYGRRKQVAEFRELMQNLREHSETPGEAHFEQMSQIIMRSQRSFKQLIDAFDDVAFACSLDGALRTVNKRTTEMLGLPYAEIVGRHLDEFLEHPQYSVLVPERAWLLEQRRWSGMVCVRLKQDSRDRYFECALNIMEEDGVAAGVSVLARDMTEQHEIENALRHQQEFQRYLLESLPDLILVIDLEERYSFVSSRIRDLFGREPEDLLGKKVGEIPEDSREFASLQREVRTGRKKFGTCEYEIRQRNGSARIMRATASPLLDSAGKLSGVIVTVRDVTMQKQLEQQVIQSERLAAMGRMIGGFAHELNNPLTSILGISELLQEEESTTPVHRQLELLHQQARRAAEIVQNLIFFSRPPAAGRTQIHLNELMERTLALHAYSLRKNNIKVDFVPDKSLPFIHGDPRQLMQVLLNLVVNAEQAIKEIKEQGTIQVRLQRNQDAVLAIFKDDGPGIPSDILPHIFDPFFTTRRPGRSTGLGLSVCRAILKEHGGNIEAATGPEGAVFTMTLPVGNTALQQSESMDSL